MAKFEAFETKRHDASRKACLKIYYSNCASITSGTVVIFKYINFSNFQVNTESQRNQKKIEMVNQATK